MYDAIIIGKSAGGLAAATSAKRMYLEKDILVTGQHILPVI